MAENRLNSIMVSCRAISRSLISQMFSIGENMLQLVRLPQTNGTDQGGARAHFFGTSGNGGNSENW
jgi:hypothetical protein